MNPRRPCPHRRRRDCTVLFMFGLMLAMLVRSMAVRAHGQPIRHPTNLPATSSPRSR